MELLALQRCKEEGCAGFGRAVTLWSCKAERWVVSVSCEGDGARGLRAAAENERDAAFWVLYGGAVAA